MAIRKVLIANRGEIAVRIIRACADVGLSSVAVFSEADRTALHVRYADEAYPIGPAPARESYLRGDVIIDTAKRCGADAIHPGYGFLSERADFAEAVQAAGLTWIGPSPEAIRRMGDKIEAKRIAKEAGLPLVPGTDHEIDDADEASRIAERIGYPVLIKASAGGGGKGMRVVHNTTQMHDALRAATSEASGAFGYGGVYIEKYIESARHVEIQVLGDAEGNVIHLGERECSIQRRHQKLIEESPSPIMDPELRERMGAVAVAAARAVGYQSAGTIEFLLTPDKQFYFLEMNTRLQVEHPVTEWVTGLDLVIAQFRIATGRPLPWTQERVRLTGHAIECRIAAEDPFNNFMPSVGTIRLVKEPSGPGVRLDSAIYRGGEVSLYYDPMLAKVIVWGVNRPQAILRMRRALQEFRIVGIATNIPYHLAVLDSIDFQRGLFDTHFVSEFTGLQARPRTEQQFHTEERLHRLAATAAVLAAYRQREEQQARAGAMSTPASGNGRGTSDGSGWKAAGRRAMLRGE
jgi:acetyl-CoA carboxylase biotin carboxylase subunit